MQAADVREVSAPLAKETAARWKWIALPGGDDVAYIARNGSLTVAVYRYASWSGDRVAWSVECSSGYRRLSSMHEAFSLADAYLSQPLHPGLTVGMDLPEGCEAEGEIPADPGEVVRGGPRFLVRVFLPSQIVLVASVVDSLGDTEVFVTAYSRREGRNLLCMRMDADPVLISRCIEGLAGVLADFVPLPAEESSR